MKIIRTYRYITCNKKIIRTYRYITCNKRIIRTYRYITCNKKIIRTYRYITCNKKILFVKNMLAYCGYSPTSPFFLLLSELKHCDNPATNSNSDNARSRILASVRGSVGTGTKKISQVLGAFGLLDFTMSRPVLAWRAFLKLWTFYFLNFQFFFFGLRPTAETESMRLENSCEDVHCAVIKLWLNTVLILWFTFWVLYLVDHMGVIFYIPASLKLVIWISCRNM
jgi:hypothetical protein